MLLPFYRQMSLIRQRNSLQKQLMDEKQALYDLQAYAATLGQGRLTMASVASLPASVFSDGVTFMGMSNQMALAEAQQKFSIFQQSGMMQQQQGMTPIQQQQMQRYYFNCFAEQAYQRARKAKEAELNNVKHLYEEQEFSILYGSNIDFKKLYGAANDKTRKHHVQVELADLIEQKEELEIEVNYLKRRSNFLRGLVEAKTATLEVKGND